MAGSARGLPEAQRRARERTRHGLALLVLCLGLFAVGLDARYIWDKDEGVHATTVREMVERGDWVTPRFNGEPFYDKPVLFTWLAAGATVLLGPTETAVRLPAALCGLAGVLATWLLGRWLFGARAGFLGALVLATSFQYIVLSRIVVHDIALCAATTWALAFFWLGYREGGRRAAPFLGFAAASGLAVLAKGPVGLLPPLVVVLFLVWERRPAFLLRMRPLRSAAVMLAVAAPWYVLMLLHNDDYANSFFLRKVAGSLVPSDESTQKAKALYYYAVVIAAGLLPWTVALPAAVASLRGSLRAETRFLLAWVAAVLVPFTLATAKLATYVLPLFPPLALLIAHALDQEWSRQDTTQRRLLAWPAFATAVLALAALVAAPLVAPADLEARIGIGVGWACLAAGLLAAGAGAAGASALRGRPRGFVGALSGTSVALLAVWVGVLAPRMNDSSSRNIALAVDPLLAPGSPVPVYQVATGIFDAGLFYTGRTALELQRPLRLRRYLRSPERVLVVTDRQHEEELRERSDIWPLVHVLQREGSRLVLSNRPGLPEAPVEVLIDEP
jgi:4-amino-4-deoxy-L-arabinose transferase-like glycosyltransferase